MTNLTRYEKDVEALVDKGMRLFAAMGYGRDAGGFLESIRETLHDEESVQHVVTGLLSFEAEYQIWYSEAIALIRQLLPGREADFRAYYEKPKSRKSVTRENYTIEDYLAGLVVAGQSTRPIAAELRFRQQIGIVEAMRQRFRSSLFDIRQLVQADLFDSELDAATELVRSGFTRAAGAMAGVVLERHLKEVCLSHKVTVRKNKPQIADLNDGLKRAEVIEVAQWRLIQHLGDLRNLCDHDREVEPTAEEVTGLIEGVAKVTKTIL